MVRFLPYTDNFVKRIVFQGCARPWWVYLETFLPCFIECAIMYTIPFYDDILVDYAREDAKLGSRLSGRGFKHTKRFKLPVAETKWQRYGRNALKWVLIADTPVEYLGFAFLVYGATEQFFHNWQTLLEQSPYCTGPNGIYHAHNENAYIPILPGGAGTPLPYIDQQNAVTPIGTTGASFPFGKYFVTFCVTITGPHGGITGVYLRLNFTGTFPVYQVKSDTVDIAEGEEVDLIANADFFAYLIGGGSVGWELVGPAVPAGLFSAKATIIVARTDQP